MPIPSDDDIGAPSRATSSVVSAASAEPSIGAAYAEPGIGATIGFDKEMQKPYKKTKIGKKVIVEYGEWLDPGDNATPTNAMNAVWLSLCIRERRQI